MNEFAPIKPTDLAEATIGNPSSFLFDAQRMRALMDFADMMSKGRVTIPKHLQDKPADCLAITLQAMRWRMDPYIVGGKTHVVNGNLGYEAQLVVAVLKNSGAVKGRPHYGYRGEGNALECRAGFVPAGEDAVLWTEWLSIARITTQNSPLWKVNPKQQFGYLQARNWARLYAPDALLGVYTEDELQVIPSKPAERHMGAVEEVQQPKLPAYPADAFANNLPAWAKVVAAGKRTAGDLLAMLSTKVTFSEEQMAAILSLKAASPQDPANPFVSEMDAAEGGVQ
ncbi:MAG: hypothetical protein RLZZ373_424 [Pseudomonadota bacterium]